ncbi:MAG: DUF4190 domain-containing protein [Verrucomicrobiota bacterium]
MQAGSTASTKTSSLAVWSLILGLLSLVFSCLTGLPSIILGAIGLTKINKSEGRLTGTGLAIAGIVLGVVCSLISFGLLAGLIMPAVGQVQARAAEMQDLSNVRQLGLACQVYASDHDGVFPENLDELYPRYIFSIRLLQTQNGEPFRYVSGLSDTVNVNTVLIYSDPYADGDRAVSFVGGHALFVREAEFSLPDAP